MPKKIKFESAVHQFFAAADRIRGRLARHAPRDAERLASWLREVDVRYEGSRLYLSWHTPSPGSVGVPLDEMRLYVRGDVGSRAGEAKPAEGMPEHRDPVAAANAALFEQHAARVIAESDLFAAGIPGGEAFAAAAAAHDRTRKEAEADFHDEWAAAADVNAIDVRRMNEACTAPEMRCIRAGLGELRGRTLLDVGCGLGEASVYFALEGAEVTASDISAGMLDITRRLAAANGVAVRTVLSASEDLGLDPAMRFDVIYTGNTLHHVDIDTTLDRLLPLLAPEGVFVSWDPLAYNPVINVYRMLATAVRTKDEHPLRLRDLRRIRNRFVDSEMRYFWFSTLLIFILMAVVQRRNPNKERYWKKVVEEADRWAWLYAPLERLDALILRLCPLLKPLCWNVVVFGKRPRPSEHARRTTRSTPAGFVESSPHEARREHSSPAPPDGMTP
jgi:2-polyprenyl-3-methyl-5-hydroxy-6-metoxy-1,4-benzoquinol methylase